MHAYAVYVFTSVYVLMYVGFDSDHKAINKQTKHWWIELLVAIFFGKKKLSKIKLPVSVRIIKNQKLAKVKEFTQCYNKKTNRKNVYIYCSKTTFIFCRKL